MDNRIIKTFCSKSMKHFLLDLRNDKGEWRAVNFVEMTAEEAKNVTSELSSSGIKSSASILPCTSCGSRNIAGCNCATKKYKCKKNEPYRLDCLYCSEMKTDHSVAAKGYSEWAGISNIPGVTKDRFGNAAGIQYGLGVAGAFKGKRIYVMGLCSDSIYNFIAPKKALETYGFAITETRSVPSADNLRNVLNDCSQFWLISDRKAHLNRPIIDIIKEFFLSGRGLYIWGDNKPYYADANAITKELFGITMSGNSKGDQVVTICKQGQRRGIIENHLLTTGIVNIYEGITIAEVMTSEIIYPLIYGSNGKVVASYHDNDGKRAIIDGGFTRLYYKWDTAGTDRYITNAAAWLTNIERFGL